MRQLACVALLVAALACDEATTAPDPPANAVRFDPPAEFRAWWNELQACAGRQGDFDRIAWYRVPGFEMVIGGESYKGYWFADGSRIYVVEYVSDLKRIVAHQMLHELLRDPGHPAEYFERRCGAVIDSGAQ